MDICQQFTYWNERKFPMSHENSCHWHFMLMKPVIMQLLLFGSWCPDSHNLHTYIAHLLALSFMLLGVIKPQMRHVKEHYYLFDTPDDQIESSRVRIWHFQDTRLKCVRNELSCLFLCLCFCVFPFKCHVMCALKAHSLIKCYHFS